MLLCAFHLGRRRALARLESKKKKQQHKILGKYLYGGSSYIIVTKRTKDTATSYMFSSPQWHVLLDGLGFRITTLASHLNTYIKSCQGLFKCTSVEGVKLTNKQWAQTKRAKHKDYEHFYGRQWNGLHQFNSGAQQGGMRNKS